VVIAPERTHQVRLGIICFKFTRIDVEDLKLVLVADELSHGRHRPGGALDDVEATTLESVPRALPEQHSGSGTEILLPSREADVPCLLRVVRAKAGIGGFNEGLVLVRLVEGTSAQCKGASGAEPVSEGDIAGHGLHPGADIKSFPVRR
jgi:hypothetical protein